ncbi:MULTISPECIES: acyltransferase [unclassified Flavobacterium]|uniref:acyltransferase family protein n=1 Tax=Flavobacterium sp. GT3R68 TaxID=2594437 RepID=UPI000F88980C|nr:acyltransferase [Flavobacterium sp. GSN2]TRW92470.1 acyltransferase [Flavobacterium sp. GT3R68]
MGIIRFLLALSVVITHCGPIFGIRLTSGEVAVQSFYIISGFYMSMILNEKYIGINNSYKLFITNRFIRLYPIYWAVVLLTLMICVTALFTNKDIITPFSSYASVHQNVFSFSYLILTNILLIGQDIVMFLGIDPSNGILFLTSDFRNTYPPLYSFLFIPQAWTLGLEITFYLIAPFILRKKTTIIIWLILLSFLLRLYIFNYLGFKNDPWSYRFFPTEIMFFLLGFLSYKMGLKYKLKSKRHNYVILGYMLFLIFIYSYLPSTRLAYIPFKLKDVIYFTSIIFSIPFLFNFFKTNKRDAKIGELSYPIYISHMLVSLVCLMLPFTFLKNGSSIAFITIVLSLALNYFIAAPIEKIRQSRLKKTQAVSI